MASYEGYCVKCREKRQFDGGTGMNRILGKKA